MAIRIRKTALSEIARLRDLYRVEAQCQIVRDSILPRGLAAPFLIEDRAGRLGYAGVWTEHFPGRLMEFFIEREHRGRAAQYLAATLEQSEATAAEVQTNLPAPCELILKHLESPRVEALLFGDGPETQVSRPDLLFRPRSPDDIGPAGAWVVELGGDVVGAGGLLGHYNPPYADLFLEVAPDARGRGVGSFLVHELRRMCRERGKIPAARCNPENEASRRTLLRGGLVTVGEIVAGSIRRSSGSTV